MSRTNVTVTGDITIDWKIARGRTSKPTSAPWDPDYNTQAYQQIGGARLLGELIKKGVQKDVARGDVLVEIPNKNAPSRAVPGRRPFWHSYTVCSEFPFKEGGKDDEWVWRVEDFLGIDRQGADLSRPPVHLMPREDGKADIVVLDEAKQGFRHMNGLDLSLDGLGKFNIWPQSLLRHAGGDLKTDAWLLLKFDRPDFDKPGKNEFWFWDYLSDHFAERLIVVVSVDDLRIGNLEISRGLSWDRSAADLVNALESKRTSWKLDRCTHLVVSMGTEGALIYSPQASGRKATLYYDPTSIEGSWTRTYPGKMIGRTQCLTASIAVQMVRASANRGDIGAAVHAGLMASRQLHRDGFEAIGRLPIEPFLPESLNFPVTSLMDSVNAMLDASPAKRKSDFHEQPVPLEVERTWAIVGMRYHQPDAVVRDPQSRSILQLAREVVVSGRRDEEWDVPVCRIGKLTAVDRVEIEGLRTIRELMREYQEAKSEPVPLSIAVFGGPGSGKSFAIREIAGSLGNKPRGQRDLTFNLSQFSDAQTIFNSLHQVRDEALRGGEPLVFWDEFDCDLDRQPRGWLRYFLSPMQDGQFTVGEVTHNVGRAIFVFAGGTSETMEQFEKIASQDKVNKGPDFLSRLKGYINVASLNHPGAELNANAVIRRAILLRSYLLQTPSRIFVHERKLGGDGKVKSSNEIVKIDGGVLDAFLRVPTYKYAARSIQSIVKMSTLSGRAMFAPSSLPTEAALSLHVEEVETFMKIVRGEAVA